jgi:mono/diheme cytochrome c family protein
MGAMPVIRINLRKLIVCGTAIILICSCKMYFDTTKDTFTASKTAESFDRGKNLVFTICGGCHYDPAVNKFIGKHLNDLPKIAGKMYSANLTHSSTRGIPPHYTDAELFYLLKTGISKSGKFMPYMMRPMMADEDINDIIVYLRSDDAAVAAADTTVGKTHINFIGKIGLRYLASPQPYNKGVPRPNENEAVSYGRYLVAVIGCYHCHSQKAKALNYFDAEKTKGYLVGGMKLKDPKGNKIYSPNLTPDKATGIGDFNEENFRKAVTEGIRPSGKKLSPPMPKFTHLTDNQVHALYTYLQSLPPVHHEVKRR